MKHYPAIQVVLVYQNALCGIGRALDKDFGILDRITIVKNTSNATKINTANTIKSRCTIACSLVPDAVLQQIVLVGGQLAVEMCKHSYSVDVILNDDS